MATAATKNGGAVSDLSTRSLVLADLAALEPLPAGAPAPGLQEADDAGAALHGTARFQFPDGFLFGAATSAHQVEGYCTNNDWWEWEQLGRVPDPSGAACDHYHRFREDFELARQLGHNAHRISIEWSRIEPEEGVCSEKELRHYRDVLEALRVRGLEPVVTLHHFTLPLWLSRKGGWENPAAVEHFGRFVALVLDSYRDLAHWWITINEPMAFAFKSYVTGEWPPGKKDYASAARVIRHLLHAHVRAYEIIHLRQPEARVSVAHHAVAFTPCDPRRMRDRVSVRARNYLVNHLFIDALHRGVARVPGLLWERLPSTRTLDFIGLNYYTRDFVHNTGLGLDGLLGGSCEREHGRSVGMRSGLGWEVYPEGLGQMLGEFSRYGLPIMISENGVSTRSDAERWNFILMHLWQVVRALGHEVPVVGYLFWSLLDNFEWAEGYRARFGLVEVDFETQERRVRPSARLLGAVIRRQRL